MVGLRAGVNSRSAARRTHFRLRPARLSLPRRVGYRGEVGDVGSAQLRRWLLDRGGLIALVAFAVYVGLAPAHIVDGDNAEFAALGATGGVAHPTGYPAYVLWLRALAWLPGSTPAHTAAIATAILGAATVLVLHAACRAWGARPIAATLAAAMYASGPVVLRYASEAEVFAMNQLVVAAVLWLAADGGPLRGGRRVVALGLVAGLGIADHVTCALAAPIGLLGAVRGVREARRPTAAAVAGAAALVVGLAPYAYLLIAPETAVSWTRLHGLGDIADHLLRRAYGGPGSFNARGGQLHPAANLAAFAATLGRAWWWLPALAGLAMLGLRCARRPGGAGGRADREPSAGREPITGREAIAGCEPIAGWRLLALAFLISGPVLAARFDIEPSGLSLYVARRFHLLPVLLLALPVAAALDLAVARVEARLRPWPAAAIAVLGLATSAVLALPDLSRVRTPAVEHAMRGLLHGLPTGAVVFVSGDIAFQGTGYLQVARGERPDAVIVLWPFVPVAWYRERLAARGVVVDRDPGREPGRDTAAASSPPSVAIIERLLTTGRSVFVDRSLGNVLKALPSYPLGTLFRILPRGQPRPPLDEVAAANRDWFAALDLDYPRPGPDDEYPTLIHEAYAATWQIIADGYTSLGRPADAASAAAVAHQLAPVAE